MFGFAVLEVIDQEQFRAPDRRRAYEVVLLCGPAWEVGTTSPWPNIEAAASERLMEINLP